MTPLRALLSWLVLLAVAFANGAARVFAYPRSLGDFRSEVISAVQRSLRGRADAARGRPPGGP